MRMLLPSKVGRILAQISATDETGGCNQPTVTNDNGVHLRTLIPSELGRILALTSF